LALLRRSNTASVKSRALVAAKKVYFGVGGGVQLISTDITQHSKELINAATNSEINLLGRDESPTFPSLWIWSSRPVMALARL
jgi:hypothetical protein